MSHTPEPWRAEWQPGQTPNHTYTHCVMCGDDSLCDTLTKADACRIVSCVNACTGMADPASEIAALRKVADTLKELDTRGGLDRWAAFCEAALSYKALSAKEAE